MHVLLDLFRERGRIDGAGNMALDFPPQIADWEQEQISRHPTIRGDNAVEDFVSPLLRDGVDLRL